MRSTYIIHLLATVALAGPVALPVAHSSYGGDVGASQEPEAESMNYEENDSAAPYGDEDTTASDSAQPDDTYAAPEADSEGMEYGEEGVPAAPYGDVKNTASDSAQPDDACAAPDATPQNEAHNAASSPEQAMNCTDYQAVADSEEAPGFAAYSDDATVDSANTACLDDETVGNNNVTSVDSEEAIDPATCQVYEVQPGDICIAIVQQLYFSLEDFFDNNPEVNTDCSNLTVGQEICLTPLVDVDADAEGYGDTDEAADAPAEGHGDDVADEPVEE